MRKLPRYVHGYIGVRGRPRHYLRRPGFPQMPLTGLPWSQEFMKEYAAQMTPKAGDSLQPIIEGVLPRSLRALAIAYYQSAAFKALKPITQGVYRNIIDAFCKTEDKLGRLYADKPAGTIGTPQIEELMQRRADKPDSANGLRKALREMMKVAVKLGWRKDDPTQGVKKIAPKKKGGFHRWTDDEIAKFEKHHPIGSKARLAMTLGLYTGQARQDVIAMGEQHISPDHDEDGNEIEVLGPIENRNLNRIGVGHPGASPPCAK